MSEPVRKIKPAPESYSPKRKPMILNMMEEMKKEINYPVNFTLPDKSTKIPPEVKHYGPAYERFANEFAHFLDYTGQGYGFIFDNDWCWE